MKARELRQKYLDFFKSKGHTIIPSESLIPENDPTVLFTTAGMHPLVPYLMGENHPGGKRVTNAQKCIRTSDIEEVGDRTHHTFFEMLGNWSFGDYFKKEAIEWSWEFLTDPKWLGLDKNRLACSVFEGDNDAPYDEEAFEVWKNLGMPEARIAKLPKKQNWWGPAGETGPCGPDTEMFYWVGDPNEVPTSFNDDHDNWVEIWNDVFMQYTKDKDGNFNLSKQQNVDTGMGLERVLAALNGLDDNYKTELFSNIIAKIEELSGKKYGESDDVTNAIRVIADHIKAATFIIGDNKGVGPSNTDQGYIVRRLIRRAIRYGRQLGIEQELWTRVVAEIVINDYKDVYGELEKNRDFVIKEIDEEEKKFINTLERGLKELFKLTMGKQVVPFVEEKMGLIQKENIGISGKELFYIFSTYGFPLEMSLEEIEINLKKIYYPNKSNYTIDNSPLQKRLVKEFNEEMKKHQELSRTASAGKFKGGLADSSDETKKLHTTAHLMLAALRKVLGDHVQQRGSNITAERLRFDFTHGEKMTDEQKREVEDLVNKAIEDKLPVVCSEMTVEEAKEKGAVGVFESKYGERVKVYKVGEGDNVFSYEICGGPHAENTGELGRFKIKKEESSSAGVRRIKAVLE